MLSFLLYLLLPPCSCFFVEINLNSKNESKSLKLLCGPPAENLNPKSNHKVLWHGSQFGNEEQQKLAKSFETDSLMPNLSIKSSSRHVCYLLASEDAAEDLAPKKKRVSRASSASIPMENGVCPPGHRIDEDRCFPCFPGSYTSGQQTKCFLCPKDFYMDKKAADSCWPCPEGKKTFAQGADSEDACVYFDELGHPAAMQSAPWIIIYSMIGVIITCVWIVIFILLVRYWKELKSENGDQSERDERGMGPRVNNSLLQRKSIINDRKASDNSGPADHIYAEISDSENTYEDPLELSDKDMYVDIEVPEPPPKKWMKSVTEEERKSVDSGGYEIPFKRSSDNQYEIPIKRSVENRLPITPMRELSANGYEVPIKNSKDDHFYKEISIKKSQSNGYEVPTKSSKDDHLYEEISIKESQSNGYEVPTKSSKDDHLYEEISIKKSQSNGYEVPFKQRADQIRNSIQEGLYDDVQYMADGQKSALDASDEDNDERLSKTYSMGFVQNSSSIDSTKNAKKSYTTYTTHLELNKRGIHAENRRKSKRAMNILETIKDKYCR